MNYLMIFIGGGLGSICRYSIGQMVSRYSNFSFPVGTFLSNFISCIILGFLISLFMGKSNIDQNLKILLIVGFCGGFSTFSTFTYEIFELLRSGNYQTLGLYVISSLLLCLLGFFAGYRLYKLNELV
ncbi:MAG: fluoride efflux transporter CrcB [Bacteroidia bacterium]|nr:fluoride efflux transporter CrcB [Bacteroidia bacterium]